MLRKEEIEDTFKKLELLNEIDRNRILPQGNNQSSLDREPVIWLIADKVTTFNIMEELKGEQDAKLE